ncbi:Plasmid stabilization system protein [Gemmata obscuriglobus]|uniref:Type II toxin-antitoxin system RelE/ParE family toxin n=2 Tax=Gemmata obscuriglobus TaxID=114 RepID=A0A2Z3H5H4_9BACT|nr:type II toxin-antitoxin system RelE/ParE family toxin [Gemmata obscuriglobus]QEG27333.1 Plasmid stabilization system protein [Gemmata obscuriglobus]VTS04181.1 Plasmid stabilization system OS=Rhizobium mesoamericanum STM3625 GN=BN77_p2200010 PE=4 SV=1: Plasmid_stabil [Gemmata obscuriglobus UQM 2246]
MEWLYEHRPAVVERFPAALAARCHLLASQPTTGRARDELYPGMRSVVIEYYTVFFTVTDEEVLVRRIIHTARDVQAAAFDEG